MPKETLTEENKKAKGDNYFGNKFPEFLKIINNLLDKNGGTWMVGNSVSGRGGVTRSLKTIVAFYVQSELSVVRVGHLQYLATEITLQTRAHNKRSKHA